MGMVGCFWWISVSILKYCVGVIFVVKVCRVVFWIVGLFVSGLEKGIFNFSVLVLVLISVLIIFNDCLMFGLLSVMKGMNVFFLCFFNWVNRDL